MPELQLGGKTIATQTGTNEPDISCKNITATSDISCENITATSDISCENITATSLTVTNLPYLSVIFPISTSGTTQNNNADLSPQSSLVSVTNNILTYSFYANSIDPESSEFTILGLTQGIWLFNATYTHNRNYSLSADQRFDLKMWENGNLIVNPAESYADTGSVSGIGSTSFTIIRNYLNAVPATVMIEYENNQTNYFQDYGNVLTIYKLG